MITVLLPSMLRPHADGADMLTIVAPVHSMAELFAALERKAPRLMRQLDDSVFNFAVNDEMLLQEVRSHPLKNGDRVEIVPAISGGRGQRSVVRSPSFVEDTGTTTANELLDSQRTTNEPRTTNHGLRT